MRQISEEFGYSETEYFRGIRLPVDDFNRWRNKKNCMADMNRTNWTQDCFEKLPSRTYHFLVFLPQKRFGLAEALKRLNGATIQKLMEANESKTQIDVNLLGAKRQTKH